MKFIFLIILFFPVLMYSQQVAESDSTKKAKIIIYNSENTLMERKNDNLTKYMYGNVKIYHDSTYFYADTAILDDKENLFAYGNIIILQHDSIKIFCDTLRYNGYSMIAKLTGKVLLENGEKQLKSNKLIYDVHNKIGKYDTGAKLIQNNSVLKSKIGIYYLNDSLIQFRYNVSIVDSSFILHTDSLDFFTEIKKAVFLGPTVINKDSVIIYCESGYYDLLNNNALFEKNAVYKKNKTRAEAEKMFYIDSLKQYLLINNARYNDENIKAKADTIIHNIKDETSILIGNAFLETKEQKAKSHKIIYYHKEDRFISEGDGFVINNEKLISAKFLNYSKKTGKGHAKGHVYYQDTVSNIIIKGFEMDIDENKDYMKCYGDTTDKLLIMIFDKNDTTYITADTLLSYRQIQQEDTTRYFKIYNNVKIFNKDYQSINDSMIYNINDTSYVLYNNPVLWSDSTQITGDTINIMMKNKSIDNIYSRENAMIVDMVAEDLFNQIKGNKIRAYFVKDSLDNMTVNGNSEVVYYMLDDNDALLGTIKTICSNIDFKFKNNQIKDIKFYVDPKSKFIPIKKEILNPQRLDKFQWLEDKRPKNKYYILE